MVKKEIKEIKSRLRKLVKKISGYKSRPKKQKKKILSEILNQVVDNYDNNQPVSSDNYELCNIERIPENIYS